MQYKNKYAVHNPDLREFMCFTVEIIAWENCKKGWVFTKKSFVKRVEKVNSMIFHSILRNSL